MADRIKVLMVDDEEKFRETTSKILIRKGYDTTIASSGEEAVEILKAKPHDVVVLDMKMPGMDGNETLAQINQIPRKPRVIMLTGHGTEESAKKSLTLGAHDYLTKPCSIDLLATKINDAYADLRKGGPKKEKRARDIMIHIDDYTTISEDSTIREAILELRKSFESFRASSRLMETGHRSILVYDRKGELTGVLSILDLMRAVRPEYIDAAKPSMADSIQYSPIFWTGLFTTQAKRLADRRVSEIMSGSPPCVDEDTNLMEVANLMCVQKRRRVLVTSKGKAVGIIREQEIFFEMASIIL
jgi:CheY-like chemotaxis protein